MHGLLFVKLARVCLTSEEHLASTVGGGGERRQGLRSSWRPSEARCYLGQMTWQKLYKPGRMVGLRNCLELVKLLHQAGFSFCPTHGIIVFKKQKPVLLARASNLTAGRYWPTAARQMDYTRARRIVATRPVSPNGEAGCFDSGNS